MKSPALHSDRKFGQTGSDAAMMPGATRRTSGRMGAALDVVWTLLVLAFIGSGIVLLRFLLILARGAIGH
jgi:hypothetical protein